MYVPANYAYTLVLFHTFTDWEGGECKQGNPPTLGTAADSVT